MNNLLLDFTSWVAEIEPKWLGAVVNISGFLIFMITITLGPILIVSSSPIIVLTLIFIFVLYCWVRVIKQVKEKRESKNV